MIEYLAPSGGGISNLKYINKNLSSSDFTKLNTSPIVLIPAVSGKTIMPIAVSIQYSNVNAVSISGAWAIGALSVLQAASTISAGLMQILTSDINGVSGTFFLNNYQIGPPAGFRTLAASDTPIVLYDDGNTSTNFTTFIFKALYLEI